jgi:cell wall assembly regulator SMI1
MLKLLIDLAQNPQHELDPPANPTALAGLESKIGFRLPPDLVQFYEFCDGGTLFIEESSFYIFSVTDIDLAWPMVHSMPMPETHKNYFALVDVHDTNFIGFRPDPDGGFSYIDIFHETFHEIEQRVITRSFHDLLLKLSEKPGAFWLKSPSN